MHKLTVEASPFSANAYAACARAWMVFGLVVPSTCFSQVDGALVTRRGASIQGAVEGPLVVLEETAEVTISQGAAVTGNLMLSSGAGKAQSIVDGSDGSKANSVKVSGPTKITIADVAAVRGQRSTIHTFDLPRMEEPKAPKGVASAVLQSDKEGDPDFRNLRDLTLKAKSRDILLPPGAYGDVVVVSGRLLLGTKGARIPARYYFQSLSVGSGGSVQPLGLTIVVIGKLKDVQGTVGDRTYTNWLDLRVTSGDFAVNTDGQIYGVVTATASLVTLGPRAQLRGGLICDQAVVGSTARFTGVAPSWSKESSGNSLPLFIHKAARLQARLSDLAKSNTDFLFSTSYTGDQPTLKITRAGAGNSRTEQADRRRAFFDACCTVFDGTGFARGTVGVPGLASGGNPPSGLSFVTLEREQFEDNLWAVGRQKEPRDSIRLIRENPLLLNLFMERGVAVATNSQTAH